MEVRNFNVQKENIEIFEFIKFNEIYDVKICFLWR